MKLFLVFTTLAMMTWIATEVVRSVYDKKRVRETGIGGTQDIWLIGISCTLIWICLAVISGVVWIGRHSR